MFWENNSGTEAALKTWYWTLSLRLMFYVSYNLTILELKQSTKRMYKIIKTEQEYDLALARLEEIFQASEDTAEGQEAE